MSKARHGIVGISFLMAFVLYLDRICLAEVVNSASFLADTKLSKNQIGDLLGAFFFTYALFQVPAGWLSDRFGARRALTLYIVLWSLLTVFTGLATSFSMLMLMRLGCGIAQAGAYPTSQAIIRRWIPLGGRARASSLVAFGGRCGGTLAPWITVWLIASHGHWRPALWINGGLGLLVAWLYWLVVRERPSEHPGCDEAERAHIGLAQDPAPLEAREMLGTLAVFCHSRGLWLNAANQFLINIGWAFLVTWLPTYLREHYHVEREDGARMVGVALAVGTIGQIAGGFLADWSIARFGLRWGRVFPTVMGGLFGFVAYAACPFMQSAWALVACCALVSFATDLANPASWAYMQDIGGRATAATGGWANMWGNLGAAASAKLVPLLMGSSLARALGPDALFFVFAGAFLLAALVGLGMDATKPLPGMTTAN